MQRTHVQWEILLIASYPVRPDHQTSEQSLHGLTQELLTTARRCRIPKSAQYVASRHVMGHPGKKFVAHLRPEPVHAKGSGHALRAVDIPISRWNAVMAPDDDS